MTVTNGPRLRDLERVLREQLEQQTAELAKLTAYRTNPEQVGVDPSTAEALIETTRQAVADTTEALRRMTDGTYGVCEACRQPIPEERLEILPHARFCMPCQRVRAS